MRKGILALRCALAGTLLAFAAAPRRRSKRRSRRRSRSPRVVRPSTSADRSSTDVLRARSSATGPGPRPAEQPRRLGRRRLRRQDQARRGRLVRIPRQRAGRGLRPQGPAPAGPGLPLCRPRLDRAGDACRSSTSRRRTGRQDADRQRLHADARRQAASPDARPGPDRERRRELDRGRALRRAGRSASCRRPSSTTRFGWRTSTSACRPTARADRRYSAAQAGGSALPSGHTSYRHLADYELELKQLAARYPKLVKPITLNHKTHEGRDVVGIEIATHPYGVNDGKPIFANMGTHHAREWPAAESTLEWAYDLLTNYPGGAISLSCCSCLPASRS